MKTKLLLSLLFTFFSYLLSSQVPQGFNYQAIARNSQGKEIVNTALQVKVSILSDTTGFFANGTGTYIWEEQQNVTTNSFGLFTILFGSSTASKVQGSAASFSAIDWKASPLYIGTKIFYTGAWKYLGTTKLGSVPYSMVSGAVSGVLTKLNIKGAVTAPFDSALFEVKNINGQTVFAVYNEGIRAYVDNGIAKGVTKGGFAIGGFGTAKAPSQSLMMISPDSARIYVNEATAKNSTKGGFAIGGFNAAKGSSNKFMLLTPLNYFIGHNSGKYDTVGNYNSTLGYETAKSLVTGSNNVFIGYQSGLKDISGSSNIFMGSQSGYSTTIGGYNVFLGTQAGFSNIRGAYNIALGRGAGYYTTDSSNVFLGDLTGYYNTSGYQNVMIGDYVGNHNTTGYRNIFVGAQSGWTNTTGTNNIFLGFNSGFSNTIGYDNVAIGNTAGENNVDGNYNVIMGTNAGNSNVSGSFNSIIGYKAGENTDYYYNTMLGYLAGNANTLGGSQVLLGYQAGRTNTGGWNTMVGSLAGDGSGTGTQNTYIGLAAGMYATGDDNIFIGRWAGRYEYTNSNKLIIESRYGDTTNTDYYNHALIYGDFLSDYLRVNGQFYNTANKSSDYVANFKNSGGLSTNWGLNVTAGSTAGTGTNYMIDFNNGGGTWKGSIVLTNNVVSVFNVSDARQKENITQTSKKGLQILNDLQVVDYDFIKSPETTHTGYIAQDVMKVLPEMVIYNEKEDAYAISTTTLIPILHKAIQEQQVLIEAQAKRIDDLEKTVNLLINQKK